MFRRCFSTSTSALPPTIQQLLSPRASNSIRSKVEVNGWVKSVRRQKRVAFAVITDGSSAEGLQAVFTNTELAKQLTNGACVRLSGTLEESPGTGQEKELQVDTAEVLGECDPEAYPIQKQQLLPEYLRDQCHFRARTDPIAAMVRLRDKTLRNLHDHFENQGFCYVHTPIITSSDCEGAGETFNVTVPPTPSAGSSVNEPKAAGSPPFFGHPAYLTVSSQLHLEALATSLSRVYTVSPCFRAERSQTNRHLAEFWMLEAEWAFAHKVGDICQVVEDTVKHALQQRLSSADIALLHKHMDEDRQKDLQKASDLGIPWTRMSYTEAITELANAQKSRRQFEFEPVWGRPLQSEHERWLAEHLVNGPVFVTNYPAVLKPFYMRANDDGKTVGCFDLLVPHLGELVGGSLREERYALLDAALTCHGLDKEAYGWYLELRKYGGAPHGGFGLGFERLISWMSGVDNVRECIPMPRWAGRMLL